MKHLVFVTTGILLALLASANPTRFEKSINNNWTFSQNGSTQTVNFPHTWNAQDCQDEKSGFWRGTCTYRNNIRITDNLDRKSVYVKFEGAYQVLDLFVNGKYAGQHTGGFTAFIFDVTNLIHNGDNDFKIVLDNTHNPDIPPFIADFTFFGGVYRDVNLVFVPKNHISVSHFASSGVYVSTPKVSEEKAELSIETHLTLATAEKGLVLVQSILDPSGKEVKSVKTAIKKASVGEDIVVTQACCLEKPVLWDIDNPKSYTVVTSLLDKTGSVIDSERNNFGCRYFKFDPEKGFFLNGRHVKLIGTNRHQDFKNLGNALPDEMHARDVRLLKEMGGNFLRIAHYPQDPIVSQMCDEMGIVNTEEIPVIDKVTMTQTFTDNCVRMAKEMVYQGYNHPSRLVWAYMNEILNRRVWESKVEKLDKTEYFAFVKQCAGEIDKAIRECDPYRPTMLPCSNSPQNYYDSGVWEFADIIGLNLYCGWYSPNLEDFGPTLDKHHTMFPGKSLVLSEYGADEDSRLHSFKPERFDYTCDYGLKFHEAYIPVIFEKEYLAGSNVWNINDFYSETRGYAVPHVNCKGLVGLDRTPKDTYWLYTAWLNNKPFTRIGGQDWKIRGGQEKEGSCIQNVDVFSNAETVELIANGKSLGTKTICGRHICFDVPFVAGENEIVARASNGTEDILRVNFQMIPEDLSEFKEMSVMMGSNRYFEDRAGGVCWIPEQEYKAGSWGYVGGSPMRPQSRKSSMPCYENDIYGTGLDPIFQTQRADMEAFKADVPDGKYYVYLYFAELAIGNNGKVLPYNLGANLIKDDTKERVFDVNINGTAVLKGFDIFKEFGSNRAVIKKFTVDVSEGKGLTIGFVSSKGKAVVNAIRIYKAE